MSKFVILHRTPSSSAFRVGISIPVVTCATFLQWRNTVRICDIIGFIPPMAFTYTLEKNLRQSAKGTVTGGYEATLSRRCTVLLSALVKRLLSECSCGVNAGVFTQAIKEHAQDAGGGAAAPFALQFRKIWSSDCQTDRVPAQREISPRTAS
jgi:hypothetical protein